MKKTLAALAVLGAFAGTSFAANVTLYGVIDQGLNYQYQKQGSADAQNSFTMKAGQNSGSRVGLKGVEDLGNGTKVGFILENGFNSDDGTFAQSDAVKGTRLFGREANLYLTGNFGTLSFGRVGALSSGLGSYNVVYGYTIFGTGWGSTAGAKGLFNLSDRDRQDNTITYVTPNFSGVKAYLQYSFNRAYQETAGNERLNDRYAGFGLKYDNAAFSTGLVIDSVLNKSSATNTKDSFGVTWGASYDFGVAKVVGMVQYGKNENSLGGYSIVDLSGGSTTAKGEGLEGYALTLGASAPALGGTFYAQVNYVDGEQSGDNVLFQGDVKRYGAAVGYSYPFSKRTFVYTFGAYSQGKLELEDTPEVKDKRGEFGFGLVHKF